MATSGRYPPIRDDRASVVGPPRDEAGRSASPLFAKRSGSLANCSHFSSLGQLQRIFDLDSEIAHRALKLGVAEQELDST
jgi:hypothetical protein